LADFKVPKVIRIASALPKNETGKVERRDLAALFARSIEPRFRHAAADADPRGDDVLVLLR
jgi:acyl-coenzyme A synthetase/AMP-(fatty) acid ligase